jgi:hypothetical protein
VNVRVQYADSVPVQGKSGSQVHGYGAFAYSAFSAYHGNFVLNLTHSISKDLLLFPYLLLKYVDGTCVFWCTHKGTKLKPRFLE